LTATSQIRAETPADFDGVREVVRQAFGRDYEASLVDALRSGGYARCALVALIDEQIVGHVLFSELPIVGAPSTIPALALAPVAVLPNHQRRGIGSQLIRQGLEDCRKQGERIVVVLGHPSFYPRFGFSSELAMRLESPFSGNPAFMALELVEGALRGLSGTVRYPPPFSAEPR
jgi:putative acetyltransferase